jgi:phosphoribosylanthranilate isomerase
VAHVKICGVTSVEDARASADAGASAIGLNFVATSPRRVDVAAARAIADSVRGRLLIVGVVADEPEARMRELVAAVGLECLQLHGDEPPEALTPFLPHAYKAVRIGGPEDVARARAYPGKHLLCDARVPGALGGTGATFDWSLVRELARERKLTLAGGLTAANVADAVRLVAPFCVDVASGVEDRAGVKNRAQIHAFIRAAQIS